MDDRYDNFMNVCQFVCQGVMLNSVFGCLMYTDTNPNIDNSIPVMNAYAERYYNKKDPIGNRVIQTFIGDDLEFNSAVLNIISESFKKGNTLESGEFTVDYRLLNNEAVLDFLSREYNNSTISSIRIIGDGFILDEEIYNNISFFDNITVDISSIERDNVTVNGKKFLNVIGANSDLQDEIDFILKDNMSDNEISELIDSIGRYNDFTKIKISLRFYNPARAVELIKRIDAAGLNENVEFEILGYPLVEYADVYEQLIDVSKNRKINVIYTCCHDLLNNYCHEPFAVENFYYSELEPGGKTTLDIYLKILDFVKNFENSVQNVDSTIEKTMTAYQFLNENYYYSGDNLEDTNYADTRNLDKIMDTDEIVCVGYANLLTLMCRRVGIPMFTYGAPDHRMNVARIIEKDNDGNVILDKICTFDPTNDCGYYTVEDGKKTRVDKKDSYTFFGLDPEIWLYDNNTSFLTLANSLAIPPSVFNQYSMISKSPFPAYYVSPYTAASYRYSMLHLMGYNYDSSVNVDDLISELQAQNRIGEIPFEMIYNTARNIERKKNSNMEDYEFSHHMSEITHRVNSSFYSRSGFFSKKNPSIVLDGGNAIVNVDTYHSHIDDHEFVDLDKIDIGPVKYQDILDLPSGSCVIEEEIFEDDDDKNIRINDTSSSSLSSIFSEEDFSEDYIAGTTIRKPRERNVYESDEDYIEFLKRYYDFYFPKAAEDSSSTYRLTKDQIIQDLPLNDKSDQIFNTVGMSEEEIIDSRRKII